MNLEDGDDHLADVAWDVYAKAQLPVRTGKLAHLPKRCTRPASRCRVQANRRVKVDSKLKAGRKVLFDPVDCPPADLPSKRVECTWGKWTKLSVSPLLASESAAKGIRVEKLEDISGLKEAIASVV